MSHSAFMDSKTNPEPLKSIYARVKQESDRVKKFYRSDREGHEGIQRYLVELHRKKRYLIRKASKINLEDRIEDCEGRRWSAPSSSTLNDTNERSHRENAASSEIHYQYGMYDAEF
jgi:hypothetical protein